MGRICHNNAQCHQLWVSLCQRGGEPGLRTSTLHPPTSRQCSCSSGQPPPDSLLDFGGDSRRRGRRSHTHTHTHTTYTFTVPPGILPVPVPRQQTGTWKMPEAEGLETSLRDTHPGSFGSFLEFLKAQVKGPRPPGGAQKNLSAPLAAGTQPGSGEAAEPHSSRASPGPSPAAPQEAPPKTKRCGFSPRLKSTASVFPPHPQNPRAIVFLQINRQ